MITLFVLNTNLMVKKPLDINSNQSFLHTLFNWVRDLNDVFQADKFCNVSKKWMTCYIWWPIHFKITSFSWTKRGWRLNKILIKVININRWLSTLLLGLLFFWKDESNIYVKIIQTNLCKNYRWFLKWKDSHDMKCFEYF